MKKYILQLGANRNGADPYLSAIRQSGYRAVLVDQPEVLKWRQLLGAPSFDLELCVNNPSDQGEVFRALEGAGLFQPEFTLGGFETLNKTAFEMDNGNENFGCLDKSEQHYLMPDRFPKAVQAKSISEIQDSIDAFEFPVVIKPANSGGGLAVYKADSASAAQSALNFLSETNNYGKTSFSSFLVEKFIDGPEYSIQGVCTDGIVLIMAVCKKITQWKFNEKDLHSPIEAGHVTIRAHSTMKEMTDVATFLLQKSGYRNGAFHVDIIDSPSGVILLEAGFRLSGLGVCDLVSRASGLSWEEATLAAKLGENPTRLRERISACTSNVDQSFGRVSLREQFEVNNAIMLSELLPRFTFTKVITHKLDSDIAEKLAPEIERHSKILGHAEFSSKSSIATESTLRRCFTPNPVFERMGEAQPCVA